MFDTGGIGLMPSADPPNLDKVRHQDVCMALKTLGDDPEGTLLSGTIR